MGKREHINVLCFLSERMAWILSTTALKVDMLGATLRVIVDVPLASSQSFIYTLGCKQICDMNCKKEKSDYFFWPTHPPPLLAAMATAPEKKEVPEKRLEDFPHLCTDTFTYYFENEKEKGKAKDQINCLAETFGGYKVDCRRDTSIAIQHADKHHPFTLVNMIRELMVRVEKLETAVKAINTTPPPPMQQYYYPMQMPMPMQMPAPLYMPPMQPSQILKPPADTPQQMLYRANAKANTPRGRY